MLPLLNLPVVTGIFGEGGRGGREGRREGGGISMHVWRRVLCQSWNSRVPGPGATVEYGICWENGVERSDRRGVRPEMD